MAYTVWLEVHLIMDKATPNQFLVCGHQPTWYFEKPIYSNDA